MKIVITTVDRQVSYVEDSRFSERVHVLYCTDNFVFNIINLTVQSYLSLSHCGMLHSGFLPAFLMILRSKLSCSSSLSDRTSIE